MNGANLLQGVNKPISPIALGTAHFTRDQQPLWTDLLDQFADNGGTAIDTGHIYRDSEPIIGDWLATRSDAGRIVICTKGGHGDNILPPDNWRETLETELSESLRRLRIDTIDMYWLHRDNPAVPVGPIVECLNRFASEGRICAFGGSNWTLPRVLEAQTYAAQHRLMGFSAVSNNLSLAVQAEPFYPGLVSCNEAETRWHLETDTPLFAWSSQARGFFTGHFSPLQDLTSDQQADPFLNRMAQVYCTPDNLERLARSEQLAQEKGDCTAMQIALAWLCHHPVSVVPVVGPRNQSELTSCIDALSIELTQAEHRWLNLETDSISQTNGGNVPQNDQT